jgi:glycosyltransferase involved in cell wall biosynthesis
LGRIKTSKPIVSVIIPTYNREKYICNAVESVLNQTYSNFEIIIVDDGSTDNTPNLILEYNDNRIKFLSQKNQGQGVARNTGIIASSGKFIAFLDSDDIWKITKLEDQIKFFQANKEIAWSYTDAYAFDILSGDVLYLFSDNVSQYSGSIAKKLILNNFIGTSTVIVKKKVLNEVGLFTNLPKAQDWELWLRIASKYQVDKLPVALTGYGVHEGMITKNHSPLNIFICHSSVIEHAITASPKIYTPLYRHAISNQYHELGLRLLKYGNQKDTRKAFLNAIKEYPYRLFSYVYILLTFLNKHVLWKIYSVRQTINNNF